MISEIAKWSIVALFVWASLMSIAGIGKVRKPSTPGSVALATAINAAIIVVVIVWWHS